MTSVHVVSCLDCLTHSSFAVLSNSMVEYADIVWYQNDSPSYENERIQVESKYGERRPTEGEFDRVIF